MNVSLNWLRDYVDWNGSNQELADLLTRTGLEVASITTKGADFPKVVVAQILESKQHPNADRLSVCQVDDGSGQPRQIVCGAKNYKVGDKVPLALPGAVLPGDFKIKTGKLRGVESEGMMCSAKELKLAEDADGLLILPADSKVGTPISNLYPPETVFEIEITPNRGDWLSHAGIAREVAAFTGKPFKGLPVSAETNGEGGSVGVSLEAPEACPFYSVRRIRNVKVGPSPQWLKQRIESAGLRAINNIVDITNYVMLELGQPLHAFDAAKVQQGIVIRRAAAGEKFLALDGREYTLSADDLVIADGEKAVALAGVMGGEDSGVTAGTTEVLLESAIFDPATVRRTGRRLDLHSDSSYRFERGVNPQGVLQASARAVQLIVEIAGGEADASESSAGQLPDGIPPVTLRLDRCRALLGLDSLSVEEIKSALTGLGLELLTEADDSTTWKIPAHRLDLPREADLIEEVARVIGIERIPARLQASPAQPGNADALYDFSMKLREGLTAAGLSEARTSTLVSESMLWQDAAALRLRNPLGEDQAYLRVSLLPGLLVAVERNIRHGAKRIGLFEVGRTFRSGEKEESATLAFVLCGDTISTTWRGEKPRALDFHDAKGIVDRLISRSATCRKIAAVAPLALAVEILVEGVRVGTIGQLSPSAARDLGSNAPVVTVELDIEVLRKLEKSRGFQEIAKFPAVTRDLAIITPLDLAFEQIDETLKAANEALLTGVQPFDVFMDPSGQRLAADRKSVAISLTFRAQDRTLNSEEVSAACDRLRQQLKSKLAVDFRE